MKLISFAEFAWTRFILDLSVTDYEKYKNYVTSYYNFLEREVRLEELVPFKNNEPVIIIPFHMHHKGSDYHAEQHIEYEELSKGCIFKNVRISAYNDGTHYLLDKWLFLDGLLYELNISPSDSDLKYRRVHLRIKDLIECNLTINDDYLNIIFGSDDANLLISKKEHLYQLFSGYNDIYLGLMEMKNKFIKKDKKHGK